MDGSSRSVVVTGASSGIGLACVSMLVTSGWEVFATVRKPEDGDRLKSSFGAAVTPLILDVTNSESITAAAEEVRVRLQGRGLDGLVNVAGIGLMRPIEYVSKEDMVNIFNINVFGQVAVTQAFLPMIRKARGRIVNIGSVGAHVGIPFGGLLNASKSAFKSLNDALRLEMHPFGVRVSIVEPGAIKTPAVDKTLGDVDEVIRNLPAEGKAQYGEMLKTFAGRAYERESNGSEPDVVAEAVMQALTGNRPHARYPAGKHARLLAFLPIIIPAVILDVLLLRMLGLPTKWGAAAPSSGPSSKVRPITKYA